MNKIDRAFLTFHTNNPQILEMIVRYTRQLKGKGHTIFGMKAIFERIRWDYAIGTELSVDDKGFKISNDYTSRYARMVESQHPDLRGFFRTKQIDPTSMYAPLEVTP
jgi:hypothetical protein